MTFSNPVNLETCFQVKSHISKLTVVFPRYVSKFTITFRIPVDKRDFITEYEVVLVLEKAVLVLEKVVLVLVLVW